MTASPYPILALIRKHESLAAVDRQRVASPYDVVWAGIKPEDRPKKPLQQMTVAEVLAWQDSIDSRYQSEAAGAYQILEDTLRSLRYHPDRLFNQALQDELAVQLLERRGWGRLLRGEITPAQFASGLAKEWASLPVTVDQKGATRNVRRGQSYYSGDNLNRAGATPQEVEEAIAAALGGGVFDVTPTPIVDKRETVEQRLLLLEQNQKVLIEAVGRLEEAQLGQGGVIGRMGTDLTSLRRWAKALTAGIEAAEAAADAEGKPS